MHSRYRRSYWFPTPAWVERSSASQLLGGSVLVLIALPFGIVAAIAAFFWFMANVAFTPSFWVALIILSIIGLLNKK